MSEVKPIATVCLRGEGYAHGHMLDVQLQIMPDTDLPIGTRLYEERVVAELREKFDEQVQITARIANENASNRLRAERAEARVAELEAYLRELRADAERLDFLDQCREGTLRLDGPRLIPAYQRWGGTATHKDARAAIDAARQQGNGDERG